MRTTLLATILGAALLARPARAADSDGATIKDPSLFAGGITIATLGGVSTISGLVVLAVLAPIASQLSFFGSKPDLSGYYEVGVPLIIVGALATLGGIGMAMDGGRKVPRVAFAPFVSPRGASVGFVATF